MVLFVPLWLRSCGTLILRALSMSKQILRLVYGLSPRPTCWPQSPARFSTTSSSVKSVCKVGLSRRASLSSEQGLIEYAQELQEDDLHTRMPNIVKKSRWNRQFKSHNKTLKRLMTRVEAAERDANHREQAVAQEARLQSRDGYLLQRVPDTPPRRAVMAAGLLPSSQVGIMMPPL